MKRKTSFGHTEEVYMFTAQDNKNVQEIKDYLNSINVDYEFFIDKFEFTNSLDEHLDAEMPVLRLKNLPKKRKRRPRQRLPPKRRLKQRQQRKRNLKKRLPGKRRKLPKSFPKKKSWSSSLIPGSRRKKSILWRSFREKRNSGRRRRSSSLTS